MPPSDDPRLRDACMLLGNALRDARMHAGLNLKDAEDASGVSMQHLSDCERGRKWLSLEALVRVADAYGVLTVDLLTDVYPFGTRRKPRRPPQPPDDGRRRAT